MDTVILSQARASLALEPVKVQRLIRRSPIEMDFDVSSNVERRGILAGMLLGVGQKRGPNFFIQHPANLAEYVRFKQALLASITQKPVPLQEISRSRDRLLLRLTPKLTPPIRVMVKRRYGGDRGEVRRPFLDYLTWQGVAIWYMDCGSRGFKKGPDGRIRALEVALDARLTVAENERIAAYFAETWGFQWGLARSGDRSWLRLGTVAGKKFLQAIVPYLHASLLYKGQATYDANGRHLPQAFAPAKVKE